MMLTYLHIKNYKSLKDVELNLGGFMVLVGANAAGKTNFVDCLDFLGRCFKDGLAGAVGAKGGYENVSFRRAQRAKGALEFALRAAIPHRRPRAGRDRQDRKIEVEYEFAFKATQQAIAAEYEVTDERLLLKYLHGEERWELALDREKREVVTSAPDKSRFFPPAEAIERIVQGKVPRDELIFASRLRHWYPFRAAIDSLSSIGVYQISPAHARAPGDPSGRKELHPTGANLPAAIQHLKKAEPKAFEELLEHLNTAASAFTKIETDYTETKQLGLYLKEKGVGRRWYVNDLSDGTLRTLAIFVPLLDSRLDLVAIEEPENGIHPWVIEDFINTCRARSKGKQIVVTTHSPIVVSHLKPSELFLVDRHNGATRIFPATQVDANVEEIIRDGITDLGSYWNTGQMSAVPGGPSLFDLIEDRKEDGE